MLARQWRLPSASAHDSCTANLWWARTSAGSFSYWMNFRSYDYCSSVTEIIKMIFYIGNKMKKALCVLTLLTLTASANATNDGENVIYAGTGSAKSGSATATSSKNPFTIGYLRLSNSRDVVWGVDISGEGTLLDSTWGQNKAVKQATSYNLLIGKNVGKSETSRFDLAFVAGIREKTSSCPSSYLGYQCYADSKPNTTNAFNYGAALTWSTKGFMLGVRATGESTQAIAGIRF